MKNVMRALVPVLAALVLAGCNEPPGAPAPLATVAALASPLPQPLIAAFAPRATADPYAQIRIVFANDLVPLERLESDDVQAVLAHVHLAPALPGRFRLLTPRMIGFQADAAVPLATRVRVSIDAGLRDVHGAALAQPFGWTFETAPIALTDLPLQDDAKSEPEPVELRPTISLTANAPLDVASLAQHASLVPDGGGDAVPLAIPPNTGSPAPSPPARDDDASPHYALVASRALATGMSYAVVIAPGVRPQHGNLPSSATFRGRLRTYGRLAFRGVNADTDEARFVTGAPLLAFTNPIDTTTLDAIRIAPAPRAGTALAPFGNGATIGINPALLTPQTTYTVTVGGGLKDTFGQTLGHEERATFTVGDRSPQLWAPDGTHLFPAAGSVALDVTSVNLPAGSARSRMRALAPNDVVQHDDVSSDDFTLLGAVGSWPTLDAAAPVNTERTIEIPLRERNGETGVVAYGVTATTGTRTDETGRSVPAITTAAGTVLLTNLGAFAQWFPDGGFVRVNRIGDGTPVAGAGVAVFRSQRGDKTLSPPQACANGRTGADGIAHFARAAFAGCARLDGGKNTAPALVTIVRDGADWTYVRTDDDSGLGIGDAYVGWSSATPLSRGTLFSDRNLYQPGETAHLTAVGWFLTDGVLARGRAAAYAVELHLPNNETRRLGTLALNAFGTAEIAVPLGKTLPLGYYWLHAAAGNGEELSGTFRLAEFKPPNFKVALNAPDVALAGTHVEATTKSTYLFGPPLQGARTTYDVTRNPDTFTWKTDPAYTFGRQWFWPDQPPPVGSDVLHAVVPVDATGIAPATIPVAADLPFPMRYRVDAETTDAANLAVSDSHAFLALPSATQIGMKADFVAQAGTPLSARIVTVDPNGALQPNVAVHLELQAAHYATATKIREGSESAETSVSYATVAATDVTTGAAAVEAKLTPPAGGVYRLRANVAGAKSDATETDVEVYVAGDRTNGWAGRNPNELAVHLDKTTYAVGETAHAVIESPFPDADLMVSVVRHGALWQQRIAAHGSAPTAAFTVTEAMLPNAAFEAVAVRRGALPAEADAGGNAVARAGLASFAVALDGKRLGVSVTPERATLAPSTHQSVRVHVVDRRRHGVTGQVTLIVANDAVLQLSGYRPPDLVDIVYAAQPISTRFADNRTTLVLKTLRRPVEKGWGYGGGLSTGAEDTRIRRNFQPLAYFAGSLRTDGNGDATAAFDLPDDATTWRVMAVAATTDGRFGNGEGTFVTTKPLIVNPAVPQFARPGDRFEAGVVTTSGVAGASGSVAYSARVTAPLAFVDGDRTTAQTTFTAPIEQITRAHRVAMTAAGTGTSMLTVAGRLLPNGPSDGFSIPVPVSDLAVTESVVATGTTGEHDDVPLDVAAGTPTDAGGLRIVLANSLIPDALVAAAALAQPDERIALVAAGRLTIAADLLRLTATTRTRGPTVEAGAAARRALAVLTSLQRGDGGFAAYPGAKASDPFDSLTALAALGRARQANVPVDAALLRNAQSFAAQTLADPARWSWCKAEPCKSELRLHALDALAESGDRRTTFLGDIDAQREKLCLADQVRLARYLVLAPGYRERGFAEAQPLADRVYQTGALGTVALPERYFWFTRPVVAQALMTRLLVATNAGSATIDRMTRGLLALRRNGAWGCACQTAGALDALVDVAAAAGPPPNGTASVALGTKTLAAVTFADHRAAAVQTDVPAATLSAGRSVVRFAMRDGGPLHYALTYTYRLAGTPAGTYAGVRVTRIVHAGGQPAALATMGLTRLEQPLALDAARIYDVELQIVTDHPVDRVLIVDPLPAGMEAVDTSFRTNAGLGDAPAGSWRIDDQQVRHDRIEAYADHLGPGAYAVHYVARTVTPGTFAWPGASAVLADRPEEFGRSAAATLTVR